MSCSRSISRRDFAIGLGAATTAGLAAPALAQVPQLSDPLITETVPRNASGFRTHNWRPYFSSLRNGAILVDTRSRALHFWSEDASVYKLYPTSIPMTEGMTRRGRTQVIRMVEGPSWTATPNMRRRFPHWPAHIPPGPGNPLGTHALYLTWEYYRIHGTQDPRKIGRRSSSGCFGLYNENIAELYGMARLGTQVMVI